MKRCAVVWKTKVFLSVRPAVRYMFPGPATISGAPGKPGFVSPRTNALPGWLEKFTVRARTRDTAVFGMIWTSITMRRSTTSGRCASAAAWEFSLR